MNPFWQMNVSLPSDTWREWTKPRISPGPVWQETMPVSPAERPRDPLQNGTTSLRYLSTASPRPRTELRKVRMRARRSYILLLLSVITTCHPTAQHAS